MNSMLKEPFSLRIDRNAFSIITSFDRQLNFFILLLQSHFDLLYIEYKICEKRRAKIGCT